MMVDVALIWLVWNLIMPLALLATLFGALLVLYYILRVRRTIIRGLRK